MVDLPAGGIEYLKIDRTAPGALEPDVMADRPTYRYRHQSELLVVDLREAAGGAGLDDVHHLSCRHVREEATEARGPEDLDTVRHGGIPQSEMQPQAALGQVSALRLHEPHLGDQLAIDHRLDHHLGADRRTVGYGPLEVDLQPVPHGTIITVKEVVLELVHHVQVQIAVPVMVGRCDAPGVAAIAAETGGHVEREVPGPVVAVEVVGAPQALGHVQVQVAVVVRVEQHAPGITARSGHRMGTAVHRGKTAKSIVQVQAVRALYGRHEQVDVAIIVHITGAGTMGLLHLGDGRVSGQRNEGPRLVEVEFIGFPAVRHIDIEQPVVVQVGQHHTHGGVLVRYHGPQVRDPLKGAIAEVPVQVIGLIELVHEEGVHIAIVVVVHPGAPARVATIADDIPHKHLEHAAAALIEVEQIVLVLVAAHDQVLVPIIVQVRPTDTRVEGPVAHQRGCGEIGERTSRTSHIRFIVLIEHTAHEQVVRTITGEVHRRATIGPTVKQRHMLAGHYADEVLRNQIQSEERKRYDDRGPHAWLGISSIQDIRYPRGQLVA